jgi:hypothetical protein
MAGGRRHVPLAAGVEDMAVVREHFTRALERMHKAPKSGEPVGGPSMQSQSGWFLHPLGHAVDAQRQSGNNY